MQYKVVPFVASIDSKKENSSHVAEQLQKEIDKYVQEGWEYVRLEGVITYMQGDDGCFGIGAKPAYTTSNQMIVFQKI
jgi:hypothetical protein